MLARRSACTFPLIAALMAAGCGDETAPADTSAKAPASRSAPRVIGGSNDEDSSPPPDAAKTASPAAEAQPTSVEKPATAEPTPPAATPLPEPKPEDKPLTPAEAVKAIEASGGRVKMEGGVAVSVFLNRTVIGDDGLKPLRFLPTVKVLNIAGTQATDNGLAHLASLKQLERFYFHKTQITVAGLKLLKQSLPQVRFMPSEPKQPLAVAPGEAPAAPPAAAAPAAAAPAKPDD